MFTETDIKLIFERFKGQKVLIVGDVMIDSYIWGHVKRLSPEAPVPIVNVTRRDNRLGGAANVARNIQSLGATPILCSCIGDDEKGEQLLKLMRDEGMEASGMIKSSERLTTVKFRIIGNNAHMLRVDEESEEELNLNEEELLCELIETLIDKERIDVIIFEDYDKGTLTQTLIKKVIDKAISLAIPVVVDPKKKHFFDYRHVSLFKPNFKEFCDGLKKELTPEDASALHEEMAAFQKEQYIETMLVSLSEYGVMVSWKHEGNYRYIRIPAHLRQIADVSGAGDTLISVAALCTALRMPAEQTAALSNLAGGVVCEYVGVVPVDRDKLFSEALRLLVK